MRRAVGVALVALLLVGCGRAPAVEVGTTRLAPDDRPALPPIAGDTLCLASLRGRIVVLNDWASWCAPCREEIPALVDLAAANPDISFVGLNVSDEPAAARDFARRTGMTYPSIVDRDGALLATVPDVPAKSLPSTVIVDRQGRIAARTIGPIDAADITEIIAALRAEAT